MFEVILFGITIGLGTFLVIMATLLTFGLISWVFGIINKSSGSDSSKQVLKLLILSLIAGQALAVFIWFVANFEIGG